MKDQPYFDLNIFSRLLEVPGHVGERLIDMFLANGPRKIEQIEAAARGGDFDAVGKIAHMLITSSGMLGATELRTLAADIEGAVRLGRTQDVAGLVERLQEAYRRAEPILREKASRPDTP